MTFYLTALGKFSSEFPVIMEKGEGLFLQHTEITRQLKCLGERWKRVLDVGQQEDDEVVICEHPRVSQDKERGRPT
jgi:hypothetical protein